MISMISDKQFIKLSEVYNKFMDAANKKLTLNNAYVREFAPEKEYIEHEDGRSFKVIESENNREEEGVQNLLEDKSGWFDDFIHDELMSETTELCRALIKIERGL